MYSGTVRSHMERIVAGEVIWRQVKEPVGLARRITLHVFSYRLSATHYL